MIPAATVAFRCGSHYANQMKRLLISLLLLIGTITGATGAVNPADLPSHTSLFNAERSLDPSTPGWLVKPDDYRDLARVIVVDAYVFEAEDGYLIVLVGEKVGIPPFFRAIQFPTGLDTLRFNTAVAPSGEERRHIYYEPEGLGGIDQTEFYVGYTTSDDPDNVIITVNSATDEFYSASFKVLEEKADEWFSGIKTENDLHRYLGITRTNTGPSKPTLGESVIPVSGAYKMGEYYEKRGDHLAAVAYAGLAVSDVFLLRSLLTGAGKLFLNTGDDIARHILQNTGKGGLVTAEGMILQGTKTAVRIGAPQGAGLYGQGTLLLGSTYAKATGQASAELGRDLASSGLARPTGGYQAAHIVPTGAFSNRSAIIQKAIRLAQSRFDEFLGPAARNSTINGFWAKSGHLGTHRDKFFLALEKTLKNVKSKPQMEAALKALRNRIKSGDFIK
ncbi:hypothetical protein BVX99_01745 [bacterium F16]|nr:hypothetical protein BVX99_01745 [bacterium F16]